MAQPSVANYFNTRKRSNAVEQAKISRARKVLHHENPADHLQQAPSQKLGNHADGVESKPAKLPAEVMAVNAKIAEVLAKSSETTVTKARKPVRSTRAKKPKVVDSNQQTIQAMITSMVANKAPMQEKNGEVCESITKDDPIEVHRTPPSTPTKKMNAMDKIKMTGKEMDIKEIRQRLTRSNRLAELKASMKRFDALDSKLTERQKQKEPVPESPSLKTFKSIELEVHLSPHKSATPEKTYLSPRKDSTAKRNLLNLLSPSKNAVALPKMENQMMLMERLALSLPYKYRMLAEVFRGVDTVCQIMFNRKETITFKKLKPAVEELVKRNLYERHLSQIQFLYADAYKFRQEKIRAYGSKVETWELVVEPVIAKDAMTSDVLLERRRKLFQALIDRVKVYHQEFLSSLEPPIKVDSSKITRWHPEFDIERVPDIDLGELPQPPQEDKLTTGKDVLERARTMFNCNTRMEAALERLKNAQTASPVATEILPAVTPNAPVPTTETPASILKGIPKSLLEKIRQKQAAKALETMTRSDEKDKEIQLYSHLPEIARLTRNLYVSEKRSVLQLDVVVEKLGNCIRTYMAKTEIEARLKLIEKEVPYWLMFHNIRNQVYIKISKDTDLSLIISKLDQVLKQKQSV